MLSEYYDSVKSCQSAEPLCMLLSFCFAQKILKKKTGIKTGKNRGWKELFFSDIPWKKCNATKNNKKKLMYAQDTPFIAQIAHVALMQIVKF